MTTPIWRDALLALSGGAVCYGLSCLIVAPDGVAKGFGEQWQTMSKAPLDLLGQFPHRLLAPLLAHCVGLGGEHFLLFVRGLSVLLLGTVFFFCRRRGSAAVDALLVTVAIAVTAAVQLYKQHWVGYPDAICYALFFWMLLAAKRPVLFWSLFFANLLNHELAAFLLPWAWFVRRQANGNWRADGVGAALALGLYAAFYLWVRATAAQQLFNAEYFAEHPLFPGGSLVVGFLALTHFVVAFGPVLAVLGWHQHRSEYARERLHLWLVLAGIAAIFCIAFDWARHSNLIVIPLVLASQRFLAAGHRAAFVCLLAVGVVGMLLVPPWAPKSWPMYLMVDPALETGVVIIKPGAAPGMVDVHFGPLSEALSRWLPVAWPTLWPLLLILATIWFAGALFARVRKQPASPTAGAPALTRPD